MMKYRREIDGLRAVAVVPVILFHAGVGLFAGGFVGVDVFFVISGYLITSIILEDLTQGRFSILRFYERRARRILPALFFVLLSILPFAWLWLLPSQFEAFMAALLSVVLFVSNIFFWSEAGYFDQASELKPLLHTWSLAVEEQYYIFFPPMLALLWRFGRQPAFWVIAALGAGSLLYAEYASRYTPDAAFFLLPARAWELFAGSICAFALHNKKAVSSNIGAGLGLGLILFSVFAFDEHQRWPSVYTLVPVVGTMLIILFAQAGTWTARILSVKAIVGIGLISYSAYLWHQPLFAFARLRSLYPVELPLMLGLSVLSLILAGISWKYVEAPFRRRINPALPRQRDVFRVSLAALTVVCVFAAVFVSYPDLRRGQTMVVNDTLVDPKRAQQESWTILRSGTVDSFPVDGPDTRVLVLGDSHSKDTFNALYMNREQWPDITFRRAQLARHCRKPADPFAVEDCVEGLGGAPTDLLLNATHVLISLRWVREADYGTYLPPLVRGLQAEGKTVAVTSNTAEYYPDVPNLLRILSAQGILSGDSATTLLYESQDRNVETVNGQLQNLAADLGIPFLDKMALMCSDEKQRCLALTLEDAAVYYDYGHLTIKGAAHLGALKKQANWLKPLFE